MAAVLLLAALAAPGRAGGGWWRGRPANPPAPFQPAAGAGWDGQELHRVRETRRRARARVVDERVYCTAGEAAGRAEGAVEAAWGVGDAGDAGDAGGAGGAGGAGDAAPPAGADAAATAGVVAALVRDYALPERVAAALPAGAARGLLYRLAYAAALRPRVDPRVLIVHVQNGVGNRLRAMAGGIALAKATGRVPVVVWERDAHLAAGYRDLFVHPVGGAEVGRGRTAGVTLNDSVADGRAGGAAPLDEEMEAALYRDFVLLDQFLPWSDVAEPEPRWLAVNQMQKETVDESPPLFFAGEGDNGGGGTGDDADASAPAVITPDHHVYLKTAYVPVTRPLRGLLQKADIDPLLRRLRPVAAVQEIVAASMPANIHAAVGVHVRARSVDRDSVDVDRDCEYTADGADLTDYWRRQSQVPVFAEKMSAYLARNPLIHFFVAADDFRAVELLRAEFPGRIAHIPRECDDRTTACLHYSLADLVALARTRKIIGSSWSSFSEVAGRLSGGPLYLSGVSFGRPQPPNALATLVRRMSRFVTAVTTLGASVTDPFYKCKNRAAVGSTARRRRLLQRT